MARPQIGTVYVNTMPGEPTDGQIEDAIEALDDAGETATELMLAPSYIRRPGAVAIYTDLAKKYGIGLHVHVAMAPNDWALHNGLSNEDRVWFWTPIHDG